MKRFTIEETNLICIYISNSRRALIEGMTEALPDMDAEMRELAGRTLAKLRAMSDAEFDAQAIDFADDDAGE